MLKLTRRAALAAGGTLAFATCGRKPAAAQALGPDIEHFTPATPGTTPPDFRWTTADGQARTLADYKGQGVVLNFWATWCPPCVAEMPALDSLAKQVAGEQIAVLPLSSDRGGAAVVQAFYAENGIHNLPVLLDPESAAAHLAGTRGIPTTLLIDRDGLERGRFEGAQTWASSTALAKIRAIMNASAPEKA